jgi:hypothetical protein
LKKAIRQGVSMVGWGGLAAAILTFGLKPPFGVEVMPSSFIDPVTVIGGLLAITLGLAGLELSRRARAELPKHSSDAPPFYLAGGFAIGLGIFHVWDGLGGL